MSVSFSDNRLILCEKIEMAGLWCRALSALFRMILLSSKLKVAGSNPAGVTTYSIRFNIPNYLDAVLSNWVVRLDNFCSGSGRAEMRLIARSARRACSAART
jgi:hypothetical protein